MIEAYARQYWPVDLVADFVADGWPRWVTNPPDWFDDKWKARVPPRFVPQDDRPALLVLPAPPASNAVQVSGGWAYTEQKDE